MIAKIKSFLRRHVPHSSVRYAYVRTFFSWSKLPPGKLIRLDHQEMTNRTVLLELASQWGPVFKAIAWGELGICVVGIPLGRRLLKDHAADLKPMTIELAPLFPKGFLRQMQGEEHRTYRKALTQAIRPSDLAANIPSLETIATRGLEDYVARQNDHQDSPEAYISTLNTIASGMLVQIVLGAAFGSASFDQIMQGYRKLGPCGLVWNIGDAHREAFEEIRDHLIDQFSRGLASRSMESQPSILGRIISEGLPDATLLGNLIYMVEMGRYDTYSLFRWLTKYASENPEMLARIALEDPDATPDRTSFTEAFVLETLRTDQTERLMRKAQRDFVFEGYLIPKHATVRVCLWESHKSPDAFPEPFRFNPERFITGYPNGDQFAPFGLDHHLCPFAEIAIKTSMIFLRVLARSYTVAPIADGLPVRGLYHWEPASQFGVRLHPQGS